MGIVINAGGAWVGGNSYIGYDSLFLRSAAVVSASNEDAGFPVENGTNWLTYSGGWRTSVVGNNSVTATFLTAVAASSFGLFKHNLGDIGGSVKLQYSDDGVSFTDIAGSEQIPANNKAIFFVFPEVSHPIWRLLFSGIDALETLIVSQFFIGPALQVFGGPETGFTPPNLAFNDKFVNSRADGGDFLGRSLIRKGAKTGFNVSAVPADWVRLNWEPFLTVAQLQPFYFAWNSLAFPTEVAYCFTEDNVAKPTYQSAAHLNIRLDFIALIE
jgi:hypothetical protein